MFLRLEVRAKSRRFREARCRKGRRNRSRTSYLVLLQKSKKLHPTTPSYTARLAPSLLRFQSTYTVLVAKSQQQDYAKLSSRVLLVLLWCPPKHRRATDERSTYSSALGCTPNRLLTKCVKTASKFDQALAHFRRAVASEPENVEALFCKAVLSAQLMELFDALKV